MVSDNPLVLVVDDQEPAALMLCRLFEVNGFRTIVAYDGVQALEQAQRHLPDLILLDVMMPIMDGLQVLHELRQSPSTVDIPTILITADERTTTLERGMQLGADDFVPKPVQPREVLARAKSKIEASRLRHDLRKRTKALEALLRVGEELSANLLLVDDLIDLIIFLVDDLFLSAQLTLVYLFNEAQELTHQRARLNGGELYLNPIPFQDFLPYFEATTLARWKHDDFPFSHGMGVSLHYAGYFHGLLIVMSDTSFDSYYDWVLRGIGRQVMLAIRNAEAYELKLHYTETLERTVEERTQELRSTQQMLVQAEKLASIGRLSAGIAHEINNPLMPIIINLENAVEDIQANTLPSIEDIQQTLASAQRIQRIVARLMQFTHGRGNQALEMSYILIDDVLESVIALSRRAFKKDNVEIVTHFEPQLMIYASRDQLEQVFLNLMINAKAAMPKGGTLTISSRQIDKDLQLTFEDTGTGIDPKIKEKIFEPFVSTKENSTGLGLFITYEIIQNHNGLIQVESELGVGTTFTIRLPLAKSV